MPDLIKRADTQLNVRCLHLIEPGVAQLVKEMRDEIVALREQLSQYRMEQADVASHERWAL